MKRFKARIWSVLLSLVLVMGAVPTNGQTASAKAKIKLNKTSATLRVGKTVTIKVKNTKKKAKWSIKSGKKCIALNKKKKSSVVVKAKKAGTAKVVAKVAGKKLICKIKVKAKSSGDSVEDNDPVEGDATPAPTETPVPTDLPEQTNEPGPGVTNQPEKTNEPGPGVTNPPEKTDEPGPGVTNPPEKTDEPGVSNPPEKTDEPGVSNPPEKTDEPGSGVSNPPEQTDEPGPGVSNPPEQTSAPNPGETSSPGQNVTLPSGATKFTLGTRELAIGMSRSDVNTVLGGNSTYQEVRTGKAPQGFDTISYNTANCQEYLLIYLQDDIVVGICGIGKTMSFGDAVAGQNGNNLSGWTNLTDYQTGKRVTAAKKKAVLASEQAYAFYDALGDNTIYCIQVFDPTKVKDKDHDMIYMTDNLSYDATVTSSIATEIGYMLNAFRMYRNENAFKMHSGLAQCAQTYCNNATSSKLSGRGDPELFNALEAAGTDPWAWGEACYYDAADAISFANSLIELDDFYLVLINTKEVDGWTPTWDYAGVGMASNGKHTYVTVDYIES